jgi:hypothetical protein
MPDNRLPNTLPNVIKKTTHKISIFYYLILFSITLQSISLIPFIVKIYYTKQINNLPYTTIILQLIAFLISISIALSKRYYIHGILFIIYIVSIVYLLFLKIKHTNHNNNDDNIMLL